MWRGCDARERLPPSDSPTTDCRLGLKRQFCRGVIRKKNNADDQFVFDHDLGQTGA
jgi:hypothetical protein